MSGWDRPGLTRSGPPDRPSPIIADPMRNAMRRLGAEAALADYQSFYLSEGHVGSPGIGCPVAALSGDVARGPASLKAEFGAGVRRTIATLADSMPGTVDERVAAATRRLALLAGAVLIAPASDPDTGRAILSATASTPTPTHNE